MGKQNLSWENIDNILTSKHSTKLAEDYLSTRMLNNFGAIDIYPEHISFFKTPSIYMPIITQKAHQGGVMRNIAYKSYVKVLDDLRKYPMFYNLDKILQDTSFVILTEGIIDAESIIQHTDLGDHVTAITTASISPDQINLLAIFDTIYLALDNDNAGKKSSERITKFLGEFYNHYEVIQLDFSKKDINEYLISVGSQRFKNTIESQIF